MSRQVALDLEPKAEGCAHLEAAAEAARACGRWLADAGAAWPWCAHDECGVRADLHPGSGPVGEAVRRMVTRTGPLTCITCGGGQS